MKKYYSLNLKDHILYTFLVETLSDCIIFLFVFNLHQKIIDNRYWDMVYVEYGEQTSTIDRLLSDLYGMWSSMKIPITTNKQFWVTLLTIKSTLLKLINKFC